MEYYVDGTCTLTGQLHGETSTNHIMFLYVSLVIAVVVGVLPLLCALVHMYIVMEKIQSYFEKL